MILPIAKKGKKGDMRPTVRQRLNEPMRGMRDWRTTEKEREERERWEMGVLGHEEILIAGLERAPIFVGKPLTPLFHITLICLVPKGSRCALWTLGECKSWTGPSQV